jgi:hypothetical protein
MTMKETLGASLDSLWLHNTQLHLIINNLKILCVYTDHENRLDNYKKNTITIYRMLKNVESYS